MLSNITYDYQGEYECQAINIINGQERIVVSEPVILEVVGAPQVLHFSSAIEAHRGDNVALSLVVCADPRPRHVSWEWGSLRLEAGDSYGKRFIHFVFSVHVQPFTTILSTSSNQLPLTTGRYHADEIVQDEREDCYLASFHVMDVSNQDSRPYYLVVENDRGTDKHPIHLVVDDPVEMGYVFGIVGGCIAALLLLICLLIYALRKKNCCFKRKLGICLFLY